MASVCDECVFPFTYNNKTYHKCTWDYSSHPFCTTGLSSEHHECTNECPTENKICSECQFPFEYRGKNYSKCTSYNWKSQDYDHNLDVNGVLSWCITNKSEFNTHSGWQYCSSDCPRYMSQTDLDDILTDYKCYMKAILISALIFMTVVILLIGIICRWGRKKISNGLNREAPNTSKRTINKAIETEDKFEGMHLVEVKTRNRIKDRCTKMHLQSRCTNIQDEPQVVWDGENVGIDFETSIVLQAIPDSNAANKTSQASHKFKIMVENEIGSGSFGVVYKAHQVDKDHLEGIDVALKTFPRNLDLEQAMLLNEIELLSKLQPHLNVVRMLGSCTTNLITKENVWLVLEYCQCGDLKQFLRKNKNEFVMGYRHGSINRRLLIKWCYHIAKGMQHVAQHHIMHGDLAARNVLINEFVHNGETHFIAKVSDFGMSTRFSDNIRYQKLVRNGVPWKWMAMEFLRYGLFTITSDVWSYGVTVWEILSLGGEPYSNLTFDQLIPSILNGHRLECPVNIQRAIEYDFSGFFNILTRMCFVDDPIQRKTFSDIVNMLEMELSQGEFDTYQEMSRNI